MSKAPAMPMYWDAYLADTTHLTTEEHGAYMLLLAAMWRRNGSVPDDDKDNARILGLTTAKWRKIKARFIATISGFVIENDAITQEKLKKTWEITQEKITKNRQNGSKGGRAAASKNNSLDEANAANSQERNASIPEPEPEPSKRDTDVSQGKSNVEALCDVSHAIEAYNEAAKGIGWPSVQKLTPARRAAIKARLKDVGGLEGWGMAIDKAKASAFLRGDRGSFRMTFDFLCKQSSFTKLMEGNYDDRDNSNNNTTRGAGSNADTTARAISIAATARRAPSKDCF